MGLGVLGLGLAVDGGGSVLVCPKEVLDTAGLERGLLPAGKAGSALV